MMEVMIQDTQRKLQILLGMFMKKKPDEQETLIKSGLTEAQANKLIADKKEQAKEAET